MRKLFDAIRRVLYRMKLIKGLGSIWKDKTIPAYEDFYELIESWKEIYQGRASWLPVHGRFGERTMANMNTAKALCRELAALTFSEQVKITISGDKNEAFVKAVLKENGFYKKFPDWLELAYAIGGGAICVYLDNGQIAIDFVDGDYFVPCAWNTRRIFDGIFVSKSRKGELYRTLIKRETYDSAGLVDVVDYRLYQSLQANDLGIEIPLSDAYPNLQEQAITNGVSAPLFSYFRPSTANHVDTDSPLGVSVYASALDTLKALDIALDSFSREFVLGRKRIIVPVSAMRYVTDPQTGQRVRYFDANDEVYEAFQIAEGDNNKIIDNSVELRVDEHIAAINALLNVLCFQVGLSPGSLSFDAVQGVKTATEVISQNSKTYRTKTDNQNLLNETLVEMIDAIIALGVATEQISAAKYEITIDFDDSIITDRKADFQERLQLVSAGIVHPWELRAWYLGESDEDARRNVPGAVDLLDDAPDQPPAE